MSTSSGPVVDFQGRTMFFCSACAAPITYDDFFDMGLRLPDPRESKDDYCESQLIDTIEHVDCLRAARAG